LRSAIPWSFSRPCAVTGYDHLSLVPSALNLVQVIIRHLKDPRQTGRRKNRTIRYVAATTYWSADGKPISAAEFLKRLFGDLSDVFGYVLFDHPPRTRHERAEDVRQGGLEAVDGELRELLIGILCAYEEQGEGDLATPKLGSYLTARYGGVGESRDRLGDSPPCGPPSGGCRRGSTRTEGTGPGYKLPLFVS